MMNIRLLLGVITLSAAMSIAALADQHEAAPADDPMPEEQLTDEATPADDPMPEEQLTDEATPADDPMPEEQVVDETAPAELIIEEQSADQLIAKTVIGTRVYNINDEQVGRIDDLLIDGEAKLVGAVISIGGFLGFGAKHVGISWENLTFDPVDRVARLNADIDRDWLEQAPDFMTREQVEAEQQAEHTREQQLLEQERIEEQVQQQTVPPAQ